MLKNAKRKGSRAELKAIAILQAAGYCCTRAGGSLGMFDVIALGKQGTRAIQVKCGGARLSPLEREQIKALDLAPSITREYWRFLDYARAPIIEVL